LSLFYIFIVTAKGGSNNSKLAEAMVKGLSKESFQWGLATGMHSGLTYGLTEVCGTHDWKNRAVVGAVTGVALTLTSDSVSHEQVVQCVIIGAALSATANTLLDIFSCARPMADGPMVLHLGDGHTDHVPLSRFQSFSEASSNNYCNRANFPSRSLYLLIAGLLSKKN
jgi:hypothetical protein